MTTLNISLPVSMRSFVETQTKRGGYSTASEYLRMLIREAQKREALDMLEQKLLEGLNSGERIEATDEYWAVKEKRLFGKRRKKAVQK